MKTEEKFPYKVEILFPISKLEQDGLHSNTQLQEITDWLNNNVGCEDIRWKHEYWPLSVADQIKLSKTLKAIFLFKLKDASVYFKMVWG